MTTTAMNATYINALLADASYVDLSANINTRLANRLTQPLADFITANFEVMNQTGSSDGALSFGGFGATVWRGKSTGDYAGQTYVSMRGTQELLSDIPDDLQLALTGVTYSQLKDMVNWWLRETTPEGQQAKQIQVFPSTSSGLHLAFVAAPTVAGSGHLQNITSIDSVNGHSLGGYLATAFERIFGSQNPIGHISTFNSAGFNNQKTQNINDAFSQIATAIGGSLLRTGFANNLQTNYFAENGVNVTTNTWNPVGFNQIGQRVEIFQEDKSYVVNGGAKNHFMYKLTDVLALGDAISKLDPNFTITQLNSLVKNASNQMDASYEKLLDGLRHIIIGNVADTLIGDVSDNASSRVTFHENLKFLINNAAFQALIGKVTISASIPSVAEARTDLASFLSLYYLTPFALKTDGSIAADAQLTIANPDLATQFKEDKLLTPQQIANGEANFSDMYLADRAAMLSWINKRNTEDNNKTVLDDTAPNALFRDKNGGHNALDTALYTTEIRLGSGGDENRQHFIFGANDEADTLTGGAGTGNDFLKGGAGDDLILGYGNQYIIALYGEPNSNKHREDYFLSAEFWQTIQGEWHYYVGKNMPPSDYHHTYYINGSSHLTSIWTLTGNHPQHGPLNNIINNEEKYVVTGAYSSDPNNSIRQILTGGTGNDLISGSMDADYIDGGNDNDVMHGNTGNDYMFGGQGEDFASGGYGDDYIDGGTEADELIGGYGADHLIGGGGNDSLKGDLPYLEGADAPPESTDYSQMGDDTLEGGEGDDLLSYTNRISKCLPQASAYLRKVASDGECLRLPSEASTRAKAGCETPIRPATSAWVSPALRRASNNTSNAANSSASASHSARKAGFCKSRANAASWLSGTGLYGKSQASSLTPAGCLVSLSMLNLLQTFTRQQQISHRGFGCFFNKHMQNYNLFLHQGTKQRPAYALSPMCTDFKQPSTHRPRMGQTQIRTEFNHTPSNGAIRSQNIFRPSIHLILQTNIKIVNLVHEDDYNNHVINRQAANDCEWRLAA